MIKEITKDTEILQKISKKVNPKAKETKELIQDMLDTAMSHEGRCIGLAAIQIEIPARVIIAFDGEKFNAFINPVITNYFGEKYETEEGCMSLDGTRETVRSYGIEIMHQKNNKFVKEKYTGRYAQILQHEVDHLNGKLI